MTRKKYLKLTEIAIILVLTMSIFLGINRQIQQQSWNRVEVECVKTTPTNVSVYEGIYEGKTIQILASGHRDKAVYYINPENAEDYHVAYSKIYIFTDAFVLISFLLLTIFTREKSNAPEKVEDTESVEAEQDNVIE